MLEVFISLDAQVFCKLYTLRKRNNLCKLC
ncbi:hypothetical protein ALQ95_200188 [Pseudomonas syringae pv. ribicola]|uniref:Uncharacterized protein n=1 Tax=Pseudomonas syringae pv. ribicola TaxID=55398 RepID=A0A3M2W4H8_PSESI|nr:hypothetical protein ALQ95_200188 [Pseudomonas syringae pv. ribicola]